MWPVLAAAAAAGGEVPAIAYVAGALALISAVSVAILGLAGTLRTSSVQRQANIDKRVDDQLAKAEARNVALETRNVALEARIEVLSADRDRMKEDRDRYREQYVELRLACLRANVDPDELGGTDDGQA